MKNRLHVSILVPVHNVELYIERCVHSLFEQTYEDLEYIFVDDGSTDNSLSLLRKLIKEFPQREPHVQVFSFQENKGLPAVRNYLVDHCQTDWLMHVDSDDWIEPDLIEQLVCKQQETGADLVMSGIVYHYTSHDESRRFLDSKQKSDYFNLLFTDGAWVHVWGILIQRTIYTDNDIHVSTSIKHAEDLRVIYRLAHYATCISGTRKNGYHYTADNPNGNSTINSHKVLERALGVMDALDEARLFIVKHLPDYLELYDKKICMGQYRYFLHLSFFFGNRELHRIVSKKYRQMIHRYPSIFKDSIKKRLLYRVEYHYWFAYPLIRCKTFIKKRLLKKTSILTE